MDKTSDKKTTYTRNWILSANYLCKLVTNSLGVLWRNVTIRAWEQSFWPVGCCCLCLFDTFKYFINNKKIFSLSVICLRKKSKKKDHRRTTYVEMKKNVALYFACRLSTRSTVHLNHFNKYFPVVFIVCRSSHFCRTIWTLDGKI